VRLRHGFVGALGIRTADGKYYVIETHGETPQYKVNHPRERTEPHAAPPPSGAAPPAPVPMETPQPAPNPNPAPPERTPGTAAPLPAGPSSLNAQSQLAPPRPRDEIRTEYHPQIAPPSTPHDETNPPNPASLAGHSSSMTPQAQALPKPQSGLAERDKLPPQAAGETPPPQNPQLKTYVRQHQENRPPVPSSVTDNQSANQTPADSLPAPASCLQNTTPLPPPAAVQTTQPEERPQTAYAGRSTQESTPPAPDSLAGISQQAPHTAKQLPAAPGDVTQHHSLPPPGAAERSTEEDRPQLVSQIPLAQRDQPPVPGSLAMDRPLGSPAQPSMPPAPSHNAPGETSPVKPQPLLELTAPERTRSRERDRRPEIYTPLTAVAKFYAVQFREFSNPYDTAAKVPEALRNPDPKVLEQLAARATTDPQSPISADDIRQDIQQLLNDLHEAYKSAEAAAAAVAQIADQERDPQGYTWGQEDRIKHAQKELRCALGRDGEDSISLPAAKSALDELIKTYPGIEQQYPLFFAEAYSRIHCLTKMIERLEPYTGIDETENKEDAAPVRPSWVNQHEQLQGILADIFNNSQSAFEVDNALARLRELSGKLASTGLELPGSAQDAKQMAESVERALKTASPDAGLESSSLALRLKQCDDQTVMVKAQGLAERLKRLAAAQPPKKEQPQAARSEDSAFRLVSRTEQTEQETARALSACTGQLKSVLHTTLGDVEYARLGIDALIVELAAPEKNDEARNAAYDALLAAAGRGLQSKREERVKSVQQALSDLRTLIGLQEQAMTLDNEADFQLGQSILQTYIRMERGDYISAEDAAAAVLQALQAIAKEHEHRAKNPQLAPAMPQHPRWKPEDLVRWFENRYQYEGELEKLYEKYPELAQLAERAKKRELLSGAVPHSPPQAIPQPSSAQPTLH
ncbi:MAG TPA: hypothetical protein PLP17_03025, partial [Oligoflexia bacterium]|nr:hypothetical protein [Oligoflexia bacterium]